MPEILFGLILSTGGGAESFDPPESPRILVSRVSWDVVRPEDSAVITALAGELLEAGVHAVSMLGASRGVGVAQKAIAECPELFAGGFAIISGAGGPNFDLVEFAQRVETPVLQMIGEDESEQLMHRMVASHHLLVRENAVAGMRIYDGMTHGFLGRAPNARRDLRDFFKWTMRDADPPKWWD